MKKILVIFLAIVAIFLIIAAFVPKDYSVVRSVEINQPKAEVFNYIKYLENQDHFSKWANMDPDMKKTFKGTDGSVGFVSRWESEDENVGVGEQEIMKIEEGERIDYELRFEKPWESVSPAYMSVEATANGNTKVNWAFEGHMPYPSNMMLLFMDMEEILGNDLQEGLNNLKKILENG
jgi:uncharacterized protein YndB with AHSA1/START domain